MHKNAWLCTGLVALLGAACTDEESGEGALTIHISGEEASISGYPVGSGDDEIAFADGWTLQFRKVLVSLAEFSLETASGEDANVAADAVVTDLHQGESDLWKFAEVPARRWDRVGYRYAPPTAQARSVGDVEEADVERMRTEGYSFYIEATASKDDREVDLAWGFPFTVQLSECEDGNDMTKGLVVRDNVTNRAQITVHLDHLFFDQWRDDEASLRFDAMAAVAPRGNSGPLTLEDLATQQLSDLRDADGQPLGLAYDPASAFSPVPEDLEQYTIDAATTTGHWNGEGHCDYARE